jgi:hypothetical protein
MRLRPILTAALLALTLTACGSTEDTRPSTSTVEPAPGLTPDDLADHTRDTFTLTWATATETDKDTYCASVNLLGPDQAADEMRNGADGNTGLDWPLMAELLQAECALR